MNYKKNNYKQYPRENKFDKSFNSIDKVQAQFSSFKPNDNFLTKPEKTKKENFNTQATPYYPLPSNEGYEIFLRAMKKEQYSKTQYSLPFMLSLRDKFTEKPQSMKELKIPQKNEIRSRAKIVTEEAYRVTRNYLDENTDKRNFSITYITKNELTEEEIKAKTKILREILNKICYDNYDIFLNQILKFEYDEKLLEIFKNLIFSKMLQEDIYFNLYLNICIQMCKLYNRKTYSNEPKMNLKSLLLISIQCEFLSLDNTNVIPSFPIGNEDKKKYTNKIKVNNIKLISELYNCGLISKQIISDCINVLIKSTDALSIELLCKLIQLTYKKFIIDEREILENAFVYIEKIFYSAKLTNANHIHLTPQSQCFILDILDIKEKISNIDDLKREEIALSYNNSAYSSLGVFPNAIRKNSEVRSRKSSINPKDIEYIRRSRFNSRADELKGSKDDNPTLVDELVSYLGADIDFYQCFRLTEEEFNIIKDGSAKFLNRFDMNDMNDSDSVSEGKLNEVQNDFNAMMEELQCEKFIAVGHLLEIMFSLNIEDAKKIMNAIVYFFNIKLIDEEDIKHGIVLGLVNFRNNIIDYPNTKEYFQKFINKIKDNNIIDETILKVFQRTCDNLEKCYE